MDVLSDISRAVVGPLNLRHRELVMSMAGSSAMSFIPPKADIRQREWYFRFPIVDMAIAEWPKRGNADDVDEMHGPASRHRKFSSGYAGPSHEVRDERDQKQD